MQKEYLIKSFENAEHISSNRIPIHENLKAKFKIHGKEVDGIASFYIKLLPKPHILIKGYIKEPELQKIPTEKNIPSAITCNIESQVDLNNESIISLNSKIFKKELHFNAIFKTSPTMYFENGKIDTLFFHILNIPHEFYCKSTDCVELKFNEWHLRIFNYKNFEKVSEHLRNVGYSLTHFCILKRENRLEFTPGEANSVLESLDYFFSFLTGRRVSCIMPSGFSRGEKLVYEKWTTRKVSRWQRDEISWFDPKLMTPCIEKLLLAFMQKWKAIKHKLKQIIYWYLLANTNKLELENSIIIIQVALEIASESFRKDRGFYAAADKIRNILEEANINSKIPKELPNLRKYAKDLKRFAKKKDVDGPFAITRRRNYVVHSTSEKFYDKNANEILSEAVQLGLWYLELAILNLLEYKKEYVNRISNRIEDLPWQQNRKM